jgi:class 3 adenylate cyclase
MTTREIKRKLTAILSADVKGYTRLMGSDEEWTFRTLNAYKEVMRSLIQQYRGRVVDAPGDNMLAEFASVVDAVQCAVEIQQVLRARNALLPENRRMEFRTGSTSGMITEEGCDYGDWRTSRPDSKDWRTRAGYASPRAPTSKSKTSCP